METVRISLRGVNAYLVTEGMGEEPSVTLVDAGWRWSASSVRRAVEDAGYALEDVERVLVTHYDIDHVGGLARLASAGLDAPVYAGEPDASFLDGDEKPSIRNHKGAFQRLFGLGSRCPLHVERVEDGDDVAGFEVRAVPGHTPGHVVYIRDDSAFLGDAVREKNGSLELIPSFMSYDTEQARESVAKLAEDFEAEKAYVGHGKPVGNASERLRALVRA
ncbi:MAG: MBL fold metallo-hydrolase [Halobacteriales archaeon]|nr:MBL fold metallo-hydrolase [Halobacteriales archaeon]